MAWWRRRRREPAQVNVPAPRQATWVAPAFPPEVDELVAAAFPAPADQVECDVIPPTGTPERAITSHSTVGPGLVATVAVRLGFDDGSELHLPAEDPRARALQAVADLLVKTAPAPPTTRDEPPRRSARRTV